MKNKFQDLNDHLFAQLERLSEEGMTDEKLLSEVTRANAMVAVSDQIVAAAGLQLKAAALSAEWGGKIQAPPGLLENKSLTVVKSA